MAEASFRTVQEMLSSNHGRRGEGSIWNAGGYRYEEAASDASDHHLTTAGGVKLYVLSTSGGAYNVMAFGAKGDWKLTTGVGTDDTAAVRAAINAALATISFAPETKDVANAPVVLFPAGNYMLSSQIDLTYGLHLKGEGGCTIVVRHTGVGFLATGTASPDEFNSRHRMLFERLRFSAGNSIVAATIAPSALIQNGQDGELPTYINSENGVHFVECQFDLIVCENLFVNKRGFNIVFDRCYFNSIWCASVIRLEQNNGDAPNWSYCTSITNCDFTGIFDRSAITGSGTDGGVAIRAEGGNVWVRGGLIQGCSGNAVELGVSDTYSSVAVAQFSGVYWEANVGHHVKTGPKAVTLTFTSNWFVSGGAGNSFQFSSTTNATFTGCSTPNNACGFVGAGNIVIDRCTYMLGSREPNINLHTPNHRFETAGTGTLDFAGQLRVPAGGSVPAGGTYLVALSHYDFAQGGASGVTSELFMLRVNAGGAGFTATSVTRSVGGTNTVVFAWEYDATGQCLKVTPVTVSGGSANGFSGQVVSHNNGVFLPL